MNGVRSCDEEHTTETVVYSTTSKYVVFNENLQNTTLILFYMLALLCKVPHILYDTASSGSSRVQVLRMVVHNFIIILLY